MFPIRWNKAFRKKDGSISTINEAIQEGGGQYELPTASANTKGGIKIGNGLSMDGEVLNNSNPTQYTLPTASAGTLGGVKVGSGLAINDGVLSVPGGQVSVTPNYTTGRLECGTSGDWKYYIEMSREYIGVAMQGYEISTSADSSAIHAKIDIYAIAYNEGIVSKELITTLVHDGVNTYSDDNISVSYGGGSPSIGWNINTLETLYKTDGTTWDSFTTWAYDTTVDYILLEEDPT